MDIHESIDEVLSLTSNKFGEQFYPKFFEVFPEAEKMFRNVNLSHQGVMLTMALQVIAYNFRRPTPAYEDYLRILGYRHKMLNVEKKHYQTFEQALLTSLKHFHRENWSDDLESQWRDAFRKAANLMLRGEDVL